MILPLLVLSLAAQAPAPTQAPIRVAAMQLTPVNLGDAVAELYTEELAQHLTARGVRVTTPKQIAALLGMERQRQLAGCGDDSSCLVELAGALGVEAVLIGELGKVGETWSMNVRALASKGGEVLGQYSAKSSSEEALSESLELGAASLAASLSKALGRPLLPEVTNADVSVSGKRVYGARRWWWVPASAGVAVAGVGALLMVQSRSDHSELTATTGTPLRTEEAQKLRDGGSRKQTLGAVALGLGGAGVLTGLGMYLFGTESSFQGSALLVPGGAHLSLAGTLP